MLSRVADSIFWMCRYIERAENIARFIDVNLLLMLDSQMDMWQQWQPMVAITGDQEWFQEEYGETSQRQVLEFLTLDSEYLNSISSSLRMARENARSIRDVLPSEMWQQVNSAYHFVTGSGARKMMLNHPHDFYTQIKTCSQVFNGMAEGTMSRSEGWHFGRMGRLLERADKTSRLLDVKYFILLPKPEFVGSAYDNSQWAAVLRSASALEMYRKRYHRITPLNVVDFLTFDTEFPRSIHHCVIKAKESLHGITGTRVGSHRNSAERLIGRLEAELNYLDVHEVFHIGLHEFLDQIQSKLNDVGDAIFETFFAMHETFAPVELVEHEN